MQLLNVDWLTSGLERSREPYGSLQETGELRKNFKDQKIKNETTDSGCSGLFIVFNTAVLQLFVSYNFALLHSWPTDQQQHEQQWPIDWL